MNNEKFNWGILEQLPIWDLAFRPWFLLASLVSVASMLFWLLYLNGLYTFPALFGQGISPVIWHIHEIVFGFAVTIAIAFLLTAVQTWTGARSLHGKGLILLTLVWVVVRLLLWSGNAALQWWVIPLQSLWWLSCIFVFAHLVYKTDNRRNYLFIPLLLVMMTANLSLLFVELSGNTVLALHISRSVVLLFTLLITVIGGRVIPFFTKRAIEGITIKDTPLVDSCLLLVSLISVGSFAIDFFVDLLFFPAISFLMVGGLHLLRLSYWDSWPTRKISLLWSLHISYFLLAAGFIALGCSYFINSMSFSSALHVITIGSIGGMILAMIARVSLGHTGRLLKVSRIISLSFALVFIAALLRFTLLLLEFSLAAWNTSGILWIIAFSTFIACYSSILCKKPSNT